MKRKKKLAMLLTAVLTINLFSPMGDGLFGFWESASAAGTNLYFDAEFQPGYRLVNKNWENLDGLNVSHADRMYLISGVGPTIIRTVKGGDYFDSVSISGKRSWSAKFEEQNRNSKSWYLTDDIRVKMGGRAVVSSGQKLYLGNGGSTSTEITSSGNVTSQWLVPPERTEENWYPMRAVISGEGSGTFYPEWFMAGDMYSPGETGWDMAMTIDSKKGTPILWLTSKTDDELRAANAGVPVEKLANLKLELGIVDRKTPGAEPITVTAEAVDFQPKEASIGFQVTEKDWDTVSGKEYHIVSVNDVSKKESFSLTHYANPKWAMGELEVDTPLTDMAGNPVALPKNENTKLKGLYLDVQTPAVAQIKMSGTNVDTSIAKTPEQWPEDMDRSKLFSTVGDKAQFSIVLNEVVEHPEKSVMETIKLHWNTGYVTRLLRMEDSYALGVNNGMVTTLHFESATMGAKKDQEGKQIRPMRITGTEVLHDASDNVLPQEVDLSDIYPDAVNYLDTEGPGAAAGEIIKKMYGDEAAITIPITITDGNGEGEFAGVTGQTGQISLTSYENAPQMAYTYEVTREAAAPETLSQSGIIGGEGNAIWSGFHLTGEGSYYVHLRLTDLDGKELDNTKGLTCSLQLSDVVGNKSSQDIQITDLQIDRVKPTVQLTPQSVQVEADADGENTAAMTVDVSAYDVNKISQIQYQWVEEGGTPAAGSWQTVEGIATDSQKVTCQITDTIEGSGNINREFFVRVYDASDSSNMAETSVIINADLSKAVGQYTVTGDPSVPSDKTDILIKKPISTDGSADITDASTRATVVMGENTYVRVFRSDTEASLFDKEAKWYQVTTEGGSYTTVTPDAAPDWTYYGAVQVSIASSLKDLTPRSGEPIENTGADTTFHKDTKDPITILYAPQKNSVHGVTFGDVQNGQGETLEEKSYGGFTYYKINRQMGGIRYLFTLKNVLQEDWRSRDVDFEKSYAVLVKATAEGEIAEPMEELTERIALSNGEAQIISVPALDKNGNPWKSGAYALVVHVVQKAGGEQVFTESARIILDASTTPERAGIVKYESYPHVVKDLDCTMPIVKEAGEGEVLHNLTMGVAKPERDEELRVMEIDGHPAYTLENSHSVASKNPSGAGWLIREFRLEFTAELREGEYAGTWLGESVGKVKGIKVWNAASKGDAKDWQYSEEEKENLTVTEDGAVYTLTGSIGWYYGTGIIVSEEELKEKDIQDFALMKGNNTICYQVEMENGFLSPVYQMELSLTDQAPEMELTYELDPEKSFAVRNPKTGEIIGKESASIQASVQDVFSPNGDVKLYLATRESTPGSSRYEYKYREIASGEPIELTGNNDGYRGSSITGDDEYDICHQFFFAIDGAGNTVSAFPILENEKNDQYYYGTVAEGDFFDVSFEDLGYEGKYGIRFNPDFYSDGFSFDAVAEAFSIQIDDRPPVRLNSGVYGDEKAYGANEAGIVSYTEDITQGGIDKGDLLVFNFPYDPEKGDGELVKHTVTVTGYGVPETRDGEARVITKTFEVETPNEKLAITSEIDMTYKPDIPVRLYANRSVAFEGLKEYWVEKDVPVFKNGTYDITVQDKYGDTHTTSVNVDGLSDTYDFEVTFSETKATVNPVTVTIRSGQHTLSAGDRSLFTEEGEWVDIPKENIAGEGTGELSVTIPQNGEFWVEYDSGGEDKRLNIKVENIMPYGEIEPEIQWSIDMERYTDEESELYGRPVYGNVIAHVADKNGNQLVDPLTGLAPSYTFVPGGEKSYTFKGYTNRYGVEGKEITAELPVELLPWETATSKDDSYSPDVAVTGFALRDGVSREVEAAFAKVHERPDGSGVKLVGFDKETYEYGEENLYSDMEQLMARMGWADSYMFRVDAVDENAVKLFVKAEAGAVPDYTSGKSDTIEGVTLQGRTIQVDQNTEFVLYVVDTKGNSTMIPMNVTALGGQPEPNYAKILTKEGVVRIYLLPPNVEGIENITITNAGAEKETQEGSMFYGCPYLEAAENGELILYYTYEYQGEVFDGEVKVDVTEIDNLPPEVKERKWSANYDADDERLTNQNISLQITWNKALRAVDVVDAEGNVITAAEQVTVSHLQNKVTLVYAGNAPTIRLRVTASSNGLTYIEDVPAITTIDKQAPQVTAAYEYNEKHTQADVTITANEEVIFQKTGEQGTTFTQTVKENGKVVYRVSDRAGNLALAEITLEDLATEPLRIKLSTSAGGNAIDPAEYEAKVGDTLYINTNRAAQIYVNGETESTASTDGSGWTAVTVKEDLMGHYPSFRAVDAYGNAAIAQLLRISMADKKAPVVMVNKTTVSASERIGSAELEALLRANIVVHDETTKEEDLQVDFLYDRSRFGRLPVDVNVTDEAGNVGRARFWLRLYTGDEPEVSIDDKSMGPEEVVLTDGSKEQKLYIKYNGEAYKVEHKSGIKTTAQMKTGTKVLSSYKKEKEQTIDLTLKPGYHTICITTQSRQMYRFVLYVEE